MINIPSSQSQKWRVAHGRDVSADIVNTMSMDFDQEGYAKLARKPIALYTSTDSSAFGIPLSVVNDGSQYYAVTSAGIWTTTAGSTFTRTSDTGNEPSMSFRSDGVIFNGLLVVTGSTTVRTYNGSTWTDRGITNSSSYPHPLCVVEHLSQIAVANGPNITTYDTSYASQATCALPLEYVVVWMRWRQNNLYIGTRNISGGNAKMFIWNGSGSFPQAGYGLQTDWMYSGDEYASSICTVTSTGQIMRFNGGGFDEIEHFPVYETPYSWTSTSSPANAIGKVAPRGMRALGDSLYINIDGSLGRGNGDFPGNFLVTQPSGLWEHQTDVGLAHKAGYVYTKYNTLTVSAVASNVLTFGGSAHNAETGDAVLMRTVSTLTGVQASQTYFAVKVSDTTISLALTPYDAYNGNVITIGGSASTDSIDFSVYNSVGAISDVTPGCVSVFTNLPFYDFYGLEVMWGGRCDNASATTVSSLMSFGLGRNYGSMVTAPIYSSNVTDSFQKIIQKIKRLNLDTDKIRVKYRSTDRLGTPTPTYTNSTNGKATWTDHNTFTVDNLYKSVSSIATGDEVTIISGAGAGKVAHVSSYSVNSTTYTIVLDETITNITPGDISDVIIDNWTLINDITNATETMVDNYSQSLPEGAGSWIQFKIELRGRGVSLRGLQSITSVEKPSK